MFCLKALFLLFYWRFYEKKNSKTVFSFFFKRLQIYFWVAIEDIEFYGGSKKNLAKTALRVIIFLRIKILYIHNDPHSYIRSWRKVF